MVGHVHERAPEPPSWRRIRVLRGVGLAVAPEAGTRPDRSALRLQRAVACLAELKATLPVLTRSERRP